MRLLDAVKQEGRPFNVPDCSRNELPEFFKEMGFKIGAEVGVYLGVFTEKFLQAGLIIYAIDPWIGYSGAGRTEQVQTKQDTNFNLAHQRLSPYKNCTMIRRTSMDAVADFENAALDFVYIDGDHRFRYIAEDISEWYQKIKPGGVISGHDYFVTHPGANNVICQVEKVVDAFVDTYGIKNFYTFGRSKPTLEEEAKDDKTLSWMWIKK